MTTDRDEMARVIMMSCSSKMKPETATHYANNLIRAGYGKVHTMESEPASQEEPVKSAAEVWDEALAAAQQALAGATQYGGAYGQQQRKVSGWTSASQFVAKIPNPYHNSGIPARESEQWKALCVSAENLGKAVAEFQNAKDDYTSLYPKDSSAHQ